MIRTKTISKLEPVLKDGEKIYLYKKGSQGEVVGIYDSVKDIVEKEKILHGRFNRRSINNCLSGRDKSFKSWYHGCFVKPVIKKVA